MRRLVPLCFIVCVCVSGRAAAQTLAAEQASTVGDAPRGIAVADLNGDGYADVVSADALTDTITITWTRHDRTHLQSTTLAVGHGPFDVTTADFNRDGWLDVAVANADGDAVSIAFFDPAIRGFSQSAVRTLATGQNPRGIVAADFNDDGRTDLAVSLYNGHAVEVYLNGGTGAFTRASLTDVGSGGPQGIVAGDFNQDGHTDVVIARNAAVAIGLFGDGTGNLPTRGTFPTASSAGRRLVAGKLRGGGRDEVAIVNSNNTVTLYTWYYGCWADGPCEWRFARVTTIALPAGSDPRDIAAADLNRDGRLDLVTANRGRGTISVIPGEISGGGFGGAFTVTVGSASATRSIGVADFDHDGRIDVVVANEANDTIQYVMNRTALPQVGSGFRDDRMFSRDHPANTEPRGLCTIRQYDGRIDVVIPRADGYATVLEPANLGYTQHELIGTPASLAGCAIGDFDGTGFLDIAVLGTDGAIYAWDPEDDLSDRAGLPITTGTNLPPGYGIAAGDFNGDSYDDVVVTTVDGTVAVYLSDGYHGRSHIHFTQSWTKTYCCEENELRPAVADVNRDGKLDVIGITEAGVYVLLGDGRGSLADPRQVAATQTYDLTSFAIGDLNGDGRIDVATGHSDGSVRVAAGRGDGTFGAPSDVARVNVPWGLTAGDVNHDGRLDLVWNGGILFGKGDLTFPSAVLLDERKVGLYPVVVDANGDGLNDILALSTFDGRIGLNALWNHAWTGNTPPIANAGADDSGRVGAPVPLDASGSTDPDAHAITYVWTDASGGIIGQQSHISVTRDTPGTEVYTVRVVDSFGAAATDTVTVTFSGGSSSAGEVVLYASEARRVGNWLLVADATAAGGSKVYQPNAGAAKVVTASPTPSSYVELTFTAQAGVPYHLWIRGKADGNGAGNDSVHVQFSDSADASGAAAFRIGTTSSVEWNLEECSGCGLSGWGWEDNGWGAVNKLGSDIYFATTGTHTIRIQPREDGVAIDQIILSSATYRTTRPGAAKNDTTIVAR